MIAHQAPAQRREGEDEERQALASRLSLALIYPSIVLLVAVAVVVTLLAYVVPQVVSVYAHAKETLPLLRTKRSAGNPPYKIADEDLKSIKTLGDLERHVASALAAAGKA